MKIDFLSLPFILTVVSVVSSVLLALLVYRNNPKSWTNRFFAILSLFTGIWVTVIYLSLIPTSTQNGLLLVRLSLFFAAPLILSFYLFSKTIPLQNPRVSWTRIMVLAVFTIGLMIVSLTQVFFQSAQVVDGSVQPTPGPGIAVFGLYSIGLSILAALSLFKESRVTRGIQKEQIRYVFVAITLLLSLLIFTVLIPVNAFHVNFFVSFIPLYALMFLSITTFSIIQKKLFNVRAAVARSAAFVLLVGTLATAYGVVSFRLVNVFLGSASNSVKQTINVLFAVVLAFTFAPLRKFFERVTDSIFYRDNYDSQELVNNIGRILAGEIRLDELCHKVIKELTKEVKIDFADIVVFGEKEVHFQTRVFSPEHHDILIADLSKLGRLVIQRDELGNGERGEIMDKYGFSVSLALRTSEEFLGYLLLGNKKSGDIYNDQDIRVLKIIANELSVAVQNAKAFTEIQLFNETLQAKVSDATKRLRHANDELKELDQAKDEFISIASHQLRTPLTTVKGYASMISEGDFGKLTSKQKEPVEEILDGSERMNRLVGDLLNVSRIQAGKFYIDVVEIDFEQLVAGEVKQLEQLAGSKKVELVYKPPANKLAPMMLDQNKTEQAVMNLIDNAIHYSASPGNGHVQVSLEVHGNEVVFLVRDDGIGVPKDKQAKLFTKMFRAENAKEVRPDGTGLGLYLVKRVVEDEGGHVVFASEPGKGSTFGFRLPIGGVPKELQQKAKSIAKHIHLKV